jgi:hypothetical protein
MEWDHRSLQSCAVWFRWAAIVFDITEWKAKSQLDVEEKWNKRSDDYMSLPERLFLEPTESRRGRLASSRPDPAPA